MWSADCEAAFENAKLLLSTAPVLAAPRLDQPFKIQVDASQVGAGAVLMQVDENNIDRPVCCSKKFNEDGPGSVVCVGWYFSSWVS